MIKFKEIKVLCCFVILLMVEVTYGYGKKVPNNEIIKYEEYPSYFSVETWKEIDRVNNILNKPGVEKIVAVIDSPVKYIGGLGGQNYVPLQQQIDSEIGNSGADGNPYHGTAVMSLIASKTVRLPCYFDNNFSSKPCDKNEMVVSGVAQHLKVVNTVFLEDAISTNNILEELIDKINPLSKFTEEDKKKIRNLNKKFPVIVVLNCSFGAQGKEKELNTNIEQYITSAKSLDLTTYKGTVNRWAKKHIESKMKWNPVLLGYDLFLISIDKTKSIDYKKLEKWSEKYLHTPILIKHGDKFIFYGLNKNKWHKNEIVDSRIVEKLNTLPFDEKILSIKGYDLVSLDQDIVDVIEKNHTKYAGNTDDEKKEWDKLMFLWGNIKNEIDKYAKEYDIKFEKYNKAIKDTMDYIKFYSAGSVLVVVAAGNDHMELQSGKFGIAYADSSDPIIKTGAGCGDSYWNLCSWSNFGNQIVDILSPGEDIPVTIPVTEKSKVSSKATYANGTSFSAPIITGVAALLAQCNPDISAQDIKKLILENSYERSELRENIIKGKVLDAGKVIKHVCQRTGVPRPEKPKQQTTEKTDDIAVHDDL